MRCDASSSESSRKAEQLIAALLECNTVGEAASHVGITNRTASKWLARDDFQRMYRETRQQVVEHALGRLQNAGTVAVAKLIELTQSRNETVALKASSQLLTHLLRVQETVEIESRLAELEDRFGNVIQATPRAFRASG